MPRTPRTAADRVLRRRRMICLTVKICFCLLLVFSSLERAWAAGGDLDPSFNPGAGPDSRVEAIAVQPDGKILLGGGFDTYRGVPCEGLVRVRPDGSLDRTFTAGYEEGGVSEIQLQPDGKILVGGSFKISSPIYRDHLARLNPDGSIDTTFHAELSLSAVIKTMALQPDGKILVGGHFITYDGQTYSEVTRLNPDGSLDTSFKQGVAFLPDPPVKLLLQPDGKIIVAGLFEIYFDGTSVSSRKGIARLNSDGSLDTTFDPGAGAVTGSTVANLPVNAAALQPDGKIIIAGNFITYDGTPRYSIARVNPDGSLDASFERVTSASEFLQIFALALQPDGKVILGGYFYDSSRSPTNYHLMRLNADGSPDTTFNPGTGPNSVVYTMVLQPDGRILIGGDFLSYDGTARTYIARVLSGLDTIAFSNAAYSVNEGDGSATITLTRTGDGAGAASIKYATSDATATGGGRCVAGKDYVTRIGRVSWADGDTGDKTFTIPVCDDAVFEGGERINLTLSNVAGGGAFGSPQAAVLTIVDDETRPKLSVNSVAVTEGNTGSINAAFIVKLSAASTQTVTVNYQTADFSAAAPADYAAVPQTTLTFSPGETAKRVLVAVKGDLIDEPDEAFKVVLSSPTNATIVASMGTGVATIKDNDAAAVSITNARVTEPDAGTRAMTFTVNLSVASSRIVTVKYQTADGTATAPADYTAIGLTTLSFNPGETTKTITVLVNGELTAEPNETLFVNLSAPVNATLADAQGQGTILNDD